MICDRRKSLSISDLENVLTARKILPADAGRDRVQIGLIRDADMADSANEARSYLVWLGSVVPNTCAPESETCIR